MNKNREIILETFYINKIHFINTKSNWNKT